MKRILTGLQVTSDQFHLGNFFAAVKPCIDLGKKNPDAEVFVFVANMHSLTTVQDGGIKQNTINTLKLFLACGVDPKRYFIYNQSDIPAHAQLAWVLICYTHMGFMDRMHAYKDKVAKKKEKEVSVGLFTYPILMAADILLYDATHVPVGRDQKQHVEYARDIAQKFNHRFRDSGSDDDDTGDIFTLPESYIQEDVAIIPGTDGRKMSKSYNNYIGLLDTPSEILKKIKRIPTAAIAIDAPKNPDECNVYKIFKLFLDDAQDAALRERYTAGGLSFKEVKEELAETVVAFVTPIQEQYAKIDDDMIRDLLTTNAVKANEIASKKVAEVYEKVGFSL